MRPLTRRGFMLVEMLLGLVLLAMVASAVVVVVRGVGAIAARSTTALLADRARVSLQVFVQQELRDAMNSDVTPLSSTRVALSRPIGEAMPCADSAGVVLIADAAWTGTRAPEGARDEVLLLVDPVAETWVRMPIDSVGRERCPIDNAPAMRLDIAAHFGTAIVVRVIEPVELSAYRSGAADWFGLTPTSRSSSVQPFAGPLLPGTARFAWFTDHLDVLVPPLGGTATTVVTPLGPSP